MPQKMNNKQFIFEYLFMQLLLECVIYRHFINATSAIILSVKGFFSNILQYDWFLQTGFCC